jgi:hypothetical protein
MDFTWLWIQICLCWSHISLKKVVAWIRKPVSIWCEHLLSHAAGHLLHIELIRMLIIACGMLSHSSSMALRSCWILGGTGTRVDPEHLNMLMSKHTCLVCIQAIVELGHFQLPRIVYRSLRHGCAFSFWIMRWWRWMNGTTMGLSISSRYHCAFKMPSIKCNCVRCLYA